MLEVLLAGAIERAPGRGRAEWERRVRPQRKAPRRNTVAQDRTQLLAALTKARRQIAVAKAGTTIEFLDGIVAQGEKAIVFSAFEEPVQKIARHFGKRAVLLTAATPTARRQELVDRFQSDPVVRVFVANLIAGGVGLHLTAATQVVFNDLDWVPANHWQAEDRAYRIGQTGVVNVTYFTADGTVDDFVGPALQPKTSLIGAVVEGKGDVPLEGDLLQELERVLATLSPALADLSDAESGEDAAVRLLRRWGRRKRHRGTRWYWGGSERCRRTRFSRWRERSVGRRWSGIGQ